MFAICLPNPLPAPGLPFACSLCGFLIVSSIDKIRQQASVADSRAFSFTTVGSQINDWNVFLMLLLMQSTPIQRSS